MAWSYRVIGDVMVGKSKHGQFEPRSGMIDDPRPSMMSAERQRRPWAPLCWTGSMAIGERTAGQTWHACPPARWPSSPYTCQIVYYVASVVVLYSPEAQTQRHYRGHTEDVGSIAVHPQVSTGPQLMLPRTPCVPRGRALLTATRTPRMSRWPRVVGHAQGVEL